MRDAIWAPRSPLATSTLLPPAEAEATLLAATVALALLLLAAVAAADGVADGVAELEELLHASRKPGRTRAPPANNPMRLRASLRESLDPVRALSSMFFIPCPLKPMRQLMC